jgi:hypothetical protein
MPVGGGWVEHGFGVQLVPAPCQVLGETQAACVVTVQVPGVAQQAPAGGHGFGVQMPAIVQVPWQFDCVVTTQVPFARQQEPGGGDVAS